MPIGGWTMRRELLVAALALAATPALAYTSSGVTIQSTTEGRPQELPATLLKPDGAGPFPAVVLMHDCSGLGVRSSGAPARWARELAGAGHAVLIPDSFAPRGYPDGVCTVPITPERFAQVGPVARGIDAYAALAYLRSQPFVDGRRVGVMGGSHGGSATLLAMVQSRAIPALAEPKRNGFAAGIALYPACGARFGEWSVSRESGNRGPVTAFSGVYKSIAPLLILIGEKDDWTPADHCQALAERAQKAGQPVGIKIYPGAQHSFDNDSRTRYDAFRTNINRPDGKGATTGGDPSAWSDSIREVKAFFGKHLAAR